MFKSIAIRMPSGYLRQKYVLHSRIYWNCRQGSLEKVLYEIWRDRYRHIFKPTDASAMLREAFPDGWIHLPDCTLMVPMEEDIDTFIWEYPDLILPQYASAYDYSQMEDYFDEGPYEINREFCVKPGDIVFDCGANMGCFSAFCAGKAERVYSFEPSFKLCHRYLDKLKELYPNIIIVNCAVTNQAGEAAFCYYERSCGSSFLKESVMDRKAELKKENGSCEELVVPCISLDEFANRNHLERVDFIKADIEGSERAMLRGATRILKEFAPKLSICTYHHSDDKQVLEAIIKEANPAYLIEHSYKKLYAYVPK